jgi:hypothetical protein
MAYHPPQADTEDEDGIWARSLAAELGGVNVLIPAPSDRIALAIGHSSLDAHTHSDWLVDVARTMAHLDLDWDALMTTLERRKLLVPAASAFSYLAREIGCAIPADRLAQVIARANTRPFSERLLLLECKPKTDLSRIGYAARGVAKQIRLRRSQRKLPGADETIWRARLARRVGQAEGTMSDISAVAVATRGRSNVELILQVHMPPARRRIDIELSTDKRHLAVLRYRQLGKTGGLREIRFCGPVNLADDELRLVLQARPSRFAHNWGTADESNRYRQLPFAIRKATVSPVP